MSGPNEQTRQDMQPDMQPDAQMAQWADFYGGDLAAWPSAARAEAERWAASDPALKAALTDALREAAALDALFRDDPAPKAPVGLQARLLAQAADAQTARSGDAAASVSVRAEEPDGLAAVEAWLRRVFGGLSGAAVGGAFGAASAAGLALGVFAPTLLGTAPLGTSPLGAASFESRESVTAVAIDDAAETDALAFWVGGAAEADDDPLDSPWLAEPDDVSL